MFQIFITCDVLAFNSLGSLPQDGSYSEADLVEALKEDDVISAFFAQLSSDFPEVNKCGTRGEHGYKDQN